MVRCSHHCLAKTVVFIPTTPRDRLAALSHITKPTASIRAKLATCVTRAAHVDVHGADSPHTAQATVGGGSLDNPPEPADSAPSPPFSRRLGNEVESGRSCESPDAAIRDVMLMRLATLESEVAQLRGAVAAVRHDGAEGAQLQRPQEDTGNGERAAKEEGVAEGDKEGGSATEAVAEGLSRLHPKITRLVHSGACVRSVSTWGFR